MDDPMFCHLNWTELHEKSIHHIALIAAS